MNVLVTKNVYGKITEGSPGHPHPLQPLRVLSLGKLFQQPAFFSSGGFSLESYLDSQEQTE